MKHILLLLPLVALLVSGVPCKAAQEYACTGVTVTSSPSGGYTYTVMGYDDNSHGTVLERRNVSDKTKAAALAQAFLSRSGITAKYRCVPDSRGVLHVVK